MEGPLAQMTKKIAIDIAGLLQLDRTVLFSVENIWLGPKRYGNSAFQHGALVSSRQDESGKLLCSHFESPPHEAQSRYSLDSK